MLNTRVNSKMNTVNIKLYDIFRKDLNLPEDKARELVSVIDEAVKEGHSGHAELVNTKIDSLATKTELAETKSDIIKWMFIFWIGQVVATFGFILLFLKK